MSEQFVLVTGLPNSGKTHALQHVREPDGVLYLNCEPKRVPFKPDFKRSFNIDNPYRVLDGFNYAASKQGEIHSIFIDTLDFLMNMFEMVVIRKSDNTQKAWGDYFAFYQDLIAAVKATHASVVVMAHTQSTYDEATLMNHLSVPVKGQLKNVGIEASFSTIVSAKQMPLRIVEPFQNDYLAITEDDRDIGMKRVFQTRMTKESLGDKIRHPDKMWDRSETFIDNNIQHVLDRLNSYYGTNS